MQTKGLHYDKQMSKTLKLYIFLKIQWKSLFVHLEILINP